MNNTHTRDTILQVLKALEPELSEKHKVREIGLFGSYVRGEQDEQSDIDILVVLEEEATLFDLVRLEMFLEEQLGQTVDIVPKDDVREELRDEILRETVPL